MRSYLTHLRCPLFLGCRSASISSDNILCMVLCGICSPVLSSMSSSSLTAPCSSAYLADSTVECSLRPGRPPAGLPRESEYEILPGFWDRYLAHSFLTHAAELPMRPPICALVISPFAFWRTIHLTCDSLSFTPPRPAPRMCSCRPRRPETHPPPFPLHVLGSAVLPRSGRSTPAHGR